MKRGEKGQITIFVVLGIVLITAVLLVIFLVNRTTTDVLPEVDEVPNDFLPVSRLVEQCMQQISQEATILLGEHGGYIDPLDPVLSGRSFAYNSQKPTNSELVPLSANYREAIPYWYHLAPPDNCQFCFLTSEMPTLNDIEGQLGRYLDRNLAFCLNNFSTVKEQGFTVTELGIPGTNTFVGEDITIHTNYSILVERDGKQHTIDAFLTRIDVPLLEMLTIAKNITGTAVNGQFIENLLLYELHTYGGIRSDQLPPITTRHADGYYFVAWSQTNVEQNFKELLRRDLPALQIRSAVNALPITAENSIDQAFYDATAIDAFPGELFDDIFIDFIYLNWDPYFQVQPNSGDLIYPNTYESNPSKFIPPSRFSSFKYFYDVSVPLLVEVRKENVPGIGEYRFVFALEGNLRENKRIPEWVLGYGTIPWDYEYIGLEIDNPPSTVSNPDTGEEAPFTILPSPRLMCQQQSSAAVTIRTYDARTREPLEDVGLTFGCGAFGDCPLGSTTYNITSRKADYTSSMPLCMNGFVTLQKEGYQTKTVPVTPDGEPQIINTELEQIVVKNVTIKKIPLIFAVSGFIPGSPVDLNDDEQVILQLVKEGSGITTNSSQTIIFSDNNPQEIELVTGDYYLDGTFIDDRDIIIPANCARQCVERIIICTREIEYPSEDINLTGMPSGGVKRNWRVYNSNLQADNELIIYVLSLPNPPCIDELSWFGEVDTYSEVFRTITTPSFNVI